MTTARVMRAERARRKGMGEFYGAGGLNGLSLSQEWYTPLPLVHAVCAFLGSIDLDPCADPARRIPARRHIRKQDGDGLAVPWRGRVFVNPPYGHELPAWTKHFRTDPAMREGLLLVPARIETRWGHPLLAHPVCFIAGRMKFGNLQGRTQGAPFPSMLVYRGPRAEAFAEAFAPWGTVMCRIPAATVREGAA